MQTEPKPLPTLPLHLMLQTIEWMASTTASACWKHALQNWKDNPRALPESLRSVQSAMESASRQAEQKLENLLSGASRYLQTPYRRDLHESPVIWRKGAARLLDYSEPGAARTPVLFVPSLINRYTILDLTQEQSLLRYLAQQGLAPMVLDWDVPGKAEHDFDCANYVTERLIPAIQFLRGATGRPVTLAGYCMGGVLALAAAQLQQKDVGALALFATPWDFHAPDTAHLRVAAPAAGMFQSWLNEQDLIAPDCIQTLFSLVDPWHFPSKFARFEQTPKRSKSERDFLALEDWVNDGIPMTQGVGRDCLLAWPQQNILNKNGWRVGGVTIDPKRITQPTFISIPKNDRIVPRGCAMPLAHSIRHAKLIEPDAGHVGMIIGGHAKRQVWEPLSRWLLQRNISG